MCTWASSKTFVQLHLVESSINCYPSLHLKYIIKLICKLLTHCIYISQSRASTCPRGASYLECGLLDCTDCKNVVRLRKHKKFFWSSYLEYYLLECTNCGMCAARAGQGRHLCINRVLHSHPTRQYLKGLQWKVVYAPINLVTFIEMQTSYRFFFFLFSFLPSRRTLSP